MIQIQLCGLFTLMKKEIVRIFRIWTQTLLSSVVNITLYFLIFGSFIGDRIAPFMEVSYMAFLLPGLIMLAIVSNSFSNVASTFFTSKFQKSIEELLVAPLHPLIILLGYVSGGFVRGILVATLVTTVSLLFVPLAIYDFSLMILCISLTALLFSLFGLFTGIFANRFDDIALIPSFVLTPFTYLGGVFYSISMLPPFWQKLSLFNPILYLVNLLRYAFLGISDIPVRPALFTLSVMVCVMFGLCYWMLAKGIRIKT
ncbi:MAG: ABC transporter permease [bacterium]